MKKENLNPYVRYVGKRCAPTPYPQLLCAYDYRLLLVTQGSIGVELKDRMIPLSAGSPPHLFFDEIYPGENCAAI